MSLSPQLSELRDAIGDIERKTSAMCEGMSREQFLWRPQPQKWSVGECIEHLNTAGFLLVPRIDEALRDAETQSSESAGTYRTNLLERAFIHINSPNTRRRLKSPAGYRPALDADMSSTLEHFVELQQQLIALIERANYVHLQRVRIASPVTRVVRMNVGAWFELTIAHERRHLAQARAVVNAPDFPGGSPGS